MCYFTQQEHMHKHELIFGKQQQFQQQKIDWKQNSLRSMNASCLF